MPSAVHFSSAVALVGRFPALSGVDLTANPGEILLVLGANGAGKSSLLRTAAGLLPVTAGAATVLGCDLRRDRTTFRPRVGFLGHAAPLYDDLGAAANVRFAVRGARQDVDRVDPALDRLGITGRLRQTPAGRLSAGQRRRVALAALVARAPDLWLLDEPHAGLDAVSRSLLGELVEEAALAGATVLLTSHEPQITESLADRVLVMGGGRIVEERRGRRAPLRIAPSREDAVDVA